MIRTPRFLQPLASAAALALLVSCAAADATVTTAPAETVAGVGVLPESLSDAPQEFIPTGDLIPRATVERFDDVFALTQLIDGPRVLVIGDSILASTSRRYGNELCEALVPRGWAVEVNAEVGRFIEFGQRVLDRRLRPESGIGWDVAVISLGSNFDGDLEAYRARLLRILDTLAPRPTVLVTVTEFRADRVQVNEVIREMQQFYAEVFVIDWAELTSDDPSLLSGDRLHLSDAGRARLAEEIAAVLGDPPPSDQPGACLSTSFTDDSAVDSGRRFIPPTTLAATTPNTSSNTVGATTSTTISTGDGGTIADPATPTTDGGAGSETTINGGSETTGAPTTAPSTSAATTTAPPTTAPSTTAVPTTTVSGG